MTTKHVPGGIERLILDRKGARSYERLSRDCGGVPSDKRLHQMVTRPIKSFPDPPTIQGLAQGLNVSVMQVLAALAKSLGINVTSTDDPDSLLIVGAGRLPQSAQDLLLSMAREMLYLQDESDHSEDEEKAPAQEELDLAAFKGELGVGHDQLPE